MKLRLALAAVVMILVGAVAVDAVAATPKSVSVTARKHVVAYLNKHPAKTPHGQVTLRSCPIGARAKVKSLVQRNTKIRFAKQVRQSELISWQTGPKGNAGRAITCGSSYGKTYPARTGVLFYEVWQNHKAIPKAMLRSGFGPLNVAGGHLYWVLTHEGKVNVCQSIWVPPVPGFVTQFEFGQNGSRLTLPQCRVASTAISQYVLRNLLTF